MSYVLYVYRAGEQVACVYCSIFICVMRTVVVMILYQGGMIQLRIIDEVNACVVISVVGPSISPSY